MHEDEFATLVEEATGIDLQQQLQQWTHGTAELPLNNALKTYGFSLSQSTNDEAVYLGLNGQFKPEGMLVKQVINGGPAHLAGVSAGDVLVAMGGKRLTEINYKRFLASAQPGEDFDVIGFRAERVMEFSLRAGEAASNEWLIEKLDKPGHKVVPCPWLNG